MNWEQLKEKVPFKTWDELTYHQKHAYLKSFIPFTYDFRYGIELVSLRLYLKNTEE